MKTISKSVSLLFSITQLKCYKAYFVKKIKKNVKVT